MRRIAIIGCGVIGLTTALEIQREINNVKVTIFTENLSPNTTADVSAGLWSPYLLQNTPPESITRWSKFTLDYALDLWKNGKCDEAGISLIPSISLTTQNDIKLPEWKDIALGFHQLDERQLQELNTKHKHDYKLGFSFLTAIIEPIKLLPMLQQEFVKNGGKIVIKKIEKLNDLNNFDVIVNCCGISARTLISDNRVTPIRGQIARVRAPWQFHVLNVDDNYIIPNADCVILGGTHQEEDDLKMRDCDKDFILNDETIPNNSKINYNLMLTICLNAVTIKDQVGLRPGRDVVRIELEITKTDGKLLKIVHNYGHGGSGVTLSIGCAKDACKLVQNALTFVSKL